MMMRSVWRCVIVLRIVNILILVVLINGLVVLSQMQNVISNRSVISKRLVDFLIVLIFNSKEIFHLEQCTLMSKCMVTVGYARFFSRIYLEFVGKMFNKCCSVMKCKLQFPLKKKRVRIKKCQ